MSSAKVASTIGASRRSNQAAMFAALDQPMKRRVARRIDQLAEEPRGGGALKLRGADDFWRARIGDYPLLYRIEDERLIVLVITIGHRRMSTGDTECPRGGC